MIVLKLLQIVFIVLCFSSKCCNTLPMQCDKIRCGRYRTNETRCSHLGYIGDPITRECIPKCEKSCKDGFCNFCYCHFYTEYFYLDDNLKACERILKVSECNKFSCLLQSIDKCHKLYIINPYDAYECIPRCIPNSCGNGWCAPNGMCNCHLGYRPDPLNPTTCTKIPNYNITTYEKDTQNITTPDSNNTNNTNWTIYATGESQLNQTDDELFYMECTGQNLFNLYIPIFACVVAILLIILTILTIIIIRMKKQMSKSKMKEAAEETGADDNYYSTVNYHTKSNAVLIENVELYGETD